MKFLSIYKSSKPEGVPPTQKEMEEMGKYVEKMLKSGVVLATEGCLPSALGAKLRLSNGKFTVTDGPFHRGERDRRRLCCDAGELQSRNDRACKRLHEAGRRWRMRNPTGV